MSEPAKKQNLGCGALVAVAIVAFLMGRCSTGPSEVTQAPPPVTNSAMAFASDGERAEDAAAADAKAQISEASPSTSLDGEGGEDTMPTPSAPFSPPPTYAAGDGYTDSQGQEVSSPVYAPSAPTGASAQCRDGTYSFSHSRRGTCSHHGGVADWL